MKNGSIASIIAATISAGGAFGGYMYFRPSNLEDYLKWKGHQLAKAEDDALWKAIYEDNKDSFLSDFGTVKEDEANKWKAIRDYCNKVFKKSDYYPEIDKATKWCLDNVKTVKGQLVREGKDLSKLMKEKKQYQVATAVQGNDKFWGLLNVPNGTFEEKTNAYEKWCTESLNEKPTQGLVGNVATFCPKKDCSDFQGRLKADNLVRIVDKDIKDKFDKDFQNFNKNSKSSLIDTILDGEDKWSPIAKTEEANSKIDEEKFKKAYKKYCDSQDKKEFDNDNYSKLYPKYKVICAKPDPSKN